MMKKLLSLLLSAALVLQICGVMVWGAAEGETGPVGFWSLIEMTMDGETMTREELEKFADYGLVIYMEIREDKTVTISGMGTAALTGTWDEQTVTIEESPVPYQLEGDIFSLSMNGNSLIFERTTMEAIYDKLGYRTDVLDESVEYSKEEQTLVDQDGISAKITGYQADMSGFTVSVKCENQSDHGVLLSTEKCVLNKYAIDPTWALSLEAGESKESSLSFSAVEIAKCGFSSVDEIIFSMKAIDSSTYSTILEKEIVTVYPTGKKAEDIVVTDRTPVENEEVVVDDENCTFILQGAGEQPGVGYGVSCYFENKSDRELTFIWSNSTLNGKDVTAFYALSVLPGTRGYNKAYFLSGSLESEDLSADEITEVKATLRIYDTVEGVPETLLEKEFSYTPK